MLIKLIYQVSMVLVLPLMFLILLCLMQAGVSATFNVSDLTLFDAGDDLRSNPFEEGGDDVDQPNTKCNNANDPLEVPIGPITRARAKNH